MERHNVIPALACDPGQRDGGSALALPGGPALGAWWWHYLPPARCRGDQEAWRLTRWTGGEVRAQEVRSLAGAFGLVLEDALTLAPRWRLVVEEQFVPPARRGRSLVVLGRSAGVFEGVVSEQVVGRVERPLWSQWTRECLRASGGAKKVAAYARTTARARFPEVPAELLGVEHLVDALWMSQWRPAFPVEEVSRG